MARPTRQPAEARARRHGAQPHQMSETAELTRYKRLGLAAIALGIVTAAAGILIAHFTGLSKFSNVTGAEIYPAIPRAWQAELLGQLIALGGVLVAMAGVTLAFLYNRTMTWARASVGAALFAALMIILFGIIPNQWLTLTQATFEWTPQRIAFSLPDWLTLNNDISISYSAVKDAASGGYVVAVIGLVIVTMIRWQGREARAAASAPPPEPVSPYGRPLTKVER